MPISKAYSTGNKPNEIVSVVDFGAVGDGVNDDTAAIQAAIDSITTAGAIYFPSGTYYCASGLTVSSARIALLGDGQLSSIIEFDDGATTGINISGSPTAGFLFKDLWIRTNNVSSSTHTLIKVRSNSNWTIENCSLGRSGTLLDIDGTYIGKVIGGQVNNCNQVLKMDDTVASTADILLTGITFGTIATGSDAVIDVASPGLSVVGCTIETQNHTKTLLNAATGAQRVVWEGNKGEESGQIVCGTSVEVVINGGQLFDCYDSSTLRTIRVDSGTKANVSGIQIKYTTSGTYNAINASGGLSANGVTIDGALTGIQGGTGVITGCYLVNNTTAINASGSEMVINPNYYSGNTTDVTRTVTELTIVSGAITIGNGDFYIVDTESNAATDDLETINGGYPGKDITLIAANSSRTVVCKDAIGNMNISGDFSLNQARDTVTLKKSTDGTWIELSRSDNAS